MKDAENTALTYFKEFSDNLKTRFDDKPISVGRNHTVTVKASKRRIRQPIWGGRARFEFLDS
jgi:hypothetical protein